jgi:Na+-transporting methylmalonyl-CoA/oxaloacetate decarboxylase gamma subunit
MDFSAFLTAAIMLPNAIMANSDAIFDLARVSAPIGKDGLVNGWIITGIGMLVTFTCLTIIVFAITYLPKALDLFDKCFPEKIKEVQTSASSPVEAVAAAVVAAYHNHNNDGK